VSIKFYGFWRSLAAYRVRVALKLKGIAYEEIPVNLLAGQQHDPAYLAINPQGAVPALVIPGLSQPLIQSMAILDYLEQVYITPALMPAHPDQRARVLALAHVCASDGHPLVVPRVRNYLQITLNLDEATRNNWLQHWTLQALVTYERMLSQQPSAGCYSHGDQVTLADICLASQVTGAALFGCQLDSVPKVMAIYRTLLKLDAFAQSMPLLQADAPAAPKH
jgi:maleylacetoacetate isomerase